MLFSNFIHIYSNCCEISYNITIYSKIPIIISRNGRYLLLRFKQYIAHIRDKDGELQLLSVHLKEVQKISETIGEKLGISHITGLAGMLHDMGKYSDAFQEYLKEAYTNPDHPPKRGSVDHSTAGGKLLMELYHSKYSLLIESISNAIYSHHGQLKDMVNPDGKSPFWERKNYRADLSFEIVKQRFFQDMYTKEYLDKYVEQAVQEFQLLLQRLSSQYENQKMTQKQLRVFMVFLTKFIFSALLDADRTNTRQFEENEIDSEVDVKSLFLYFEQQLEEYLDKFKSMPLKSEVALLRQRMSDMCAQKSTYNTGIYTLSIPTGGGKTLSSLRFALKHAKKYGKERIIYVVPFTTIIEQNADEVRNILKAKGYLLEHHSNVIDEEDENEYVSLKEYQRRKKLKVAKDNWDAPIIFTTMVQFLDTFYKGKSRNSRRLHNLSNSIIIFDEVQALPIKCISLFNEALNYLKYVANSTVLLCTATQPALEYVKHNIKIDGELIDDLTTISKAFKRTSIINKIKANGWNTNEIANFVEEQLLKVDSILVILNTKTAVRKLYQDLEGTKAKLIHLSTSMCAAHRKKIIDEMRDDLEKGRQIVCISTQLIEAGVDVSFQCVIRSLAGLDSIAQAAGRCNRHGEVELRDVYVINHAEESLTMLKTIEKGKDITKNILRDIEKNNNLFEGNVLAPSAINNYFQNYYLQFESQLNYPTKYGESIYEMLFGENQEFINEYGKIPFWMRASFEITAKEFNVIDSLTTSVLVPYEEGKNLIAEITDDRFINDVTQFIKKAQQYTVNIFDQDLQKLIQNQQLQTVDFGFTKLYYAKESAYDDQYGMNYEGEAKLGFLGF